MAETVPGRACGDCTACCSVLGIDTRQIQKRTGATCRHCSGSGCAIYEARPATCQDFFCGWMQMPGLEAQWRPDQSGVFLQAIDIKGREALSLMLIADAVKTVRQSWFVDFVVAQLQRGMLLVLAVPGPIGTRSAKLLLNSDVLDKAVAGSPEQVRQVLRRHVKTLMASEFEDLPLLNSGNDTST